jgi:4-hydroxybenzoate polyprenyltransferase
MLRSRVFTCARTLRAEATRSPGIYGTLRSFHNSLSLRNHVSERVHTSTATVASPTPKTWVDSLPPRVRPYLYLTRIDKPIGSLLLFYPCAWSITMASTVTHAPPWVPLGYTALFGLGAFVMRGAGCTINDLWDRNLDKAVERTKERPLARGDITPGQAVGFLGLQLSAGLAVLTQLNWYRYIQWFVYSSLI